jgi:hypothetical protein
MRFVSKSEMWLIAPGIFPAQSQTRHLPLRIQPNPEFCGYARASQVSGVEPSFTEKTGYPYNGSD